jgi:excisionase family DNA binding protein
MENSSLGPDMLIRKSPRVATCLQSLDNIRDEIRKLMKSLRTILNGESFITDKELSEQLSVSRRTLFEWRTNELIGYIQLGGKVLYRQSDIAEFMEAHYRKPFEGF